MVTKQIIHNSLGVAEADEIAFLAKAKHLFKGLTVAYNKAIKHPTQNKWATRYIIAEDGDSQQIWDLWNVAKEHLNPHQESLLVDITEDWKNTEI